MKTQITHLNQWKDYLFKLENHIITDSQISLALKTFKEDILFNLSSQSYNTSLYPLNLLILFKIPNGSIVKNNGAVTFYKKR